MTLRSQEAKTTYSAGQVHITGTITFLKVCPVWQKIKKLNLKITGYKLQKQWLVKYKNKIVVHLLLIKICSSFLIESPNTWSENFKG